MESVMSTSLRDYWQRSPEHPFVPPQVSDNTRSTDGPGEVVVVSGDLVAPRVPTDPRQGEFNFNSN